MSSILVSPEVFTFHLSRKYKIAEVKSLVTYVFDKIMFNSCVGYQVPGTLAMKRSVIFDLTFIVQWAPTEVPRERIASKSEPKMKPQWNWERIILPAGFEYLLECSATFRM
jgi:hypothetical protein